MDVLTTPASLRRWTLASLVLNCVIVATGALVRLTASGLGCPTWPQCTGASYVPVPESGIHGVIEFGNRLITFVLAAVAVGTALAAFRQRPRGASLRWQAVGVGLGIAAQAVIGGISVLMQLNPWVVGLHMVASTILILVCVAMVHDAYELRPVPSPGRVLVLVRTLFVAGLLVVLLGTVVTGAGPNAGDGAAERNGLSLEATARAHSLCVWLVLALTILGIVLTARQPRLRRILLGLAAIELLQGGVGYLQYFTALPTLLVGLHMVLTTLFVTALGHAWLMAGTQEKSGSSAAAMNTTAR